MGNENSVRGMQSGRRIREGDVEHIKAVVSGCKGLSRKEIAETICEHWGWVTASGANKTQACMKLLEKLERQGELSLPEKRAWQARAGVNPKERTERVVGYGEKIQGNLHSIGGVWLDVEEDGQGKGLWNEHVDRHHYLGYKKPVGFRLRYWIDSPRGKLGCILVAGASKSIQVRDEWIGWTRQQRMQNLPWVINQWRFLIFPWVQVRHLASHVLGKLVQRVCRDYQERWGYRPVLMETFVDPGKYAGICYQAAGWIRLGETTGRGIQRAGKKYTTSPKLIYVHPLTRDFREKLCSEQLVGRVYE